MLSVDGKTGPSTTCHIRRRPEVPRKGVQTTFLSKSWRAMSSNHVKEIIEQKCEGVG